MITLTSPRNIYRRAIPEVMVIRAQNSEEKRRVLRFVLSTTEIATRRGRTCAAQDAHSEGQRIPAEHIDLFKLHPVPLDRTADIAAAVSSGLPRR